MDCELLLEIEGKWHISIPPSPSPKCVRATLHLLNHFQHDLSDAYRGNYRRRLRVLHSGAAGQRTALREDVPTPLRQNPAAKDQSRPAAQALMLLSLPADSLKGWPAQRSRDQRPRGCSLALIH